MICLAHLLRAHAIHTDSAAAFNSSTWLWWPLSRHFQRRFARIACSVLLRLFPSLGLLVSVETKNSTSWQQLPPCYLNLRIFSVIENKFCGNQFGAKIWFLLADEIRAKSDNDHIFWLRAPRRVLRSFLEVPFSWLIWGWNSILYTP